MTNVIAKTLATAATLTALATGASAKDWIESFELPCNHGFFNRGNLSDPLVNQCVELAYSQMLTFFDVYLQ